MKIASLCEREIVSVPASASVRQAAIAMRDQHVGALAVTDPYAPGRVIGIVTDRDLVLQVLATGHPVEGQAVGAVCGTELAGVAGDASLDDAVQAMQRSGVRRLLVLGEGDAVIGLVSVDDVLEAVARELDALSGTLRSGALREGARERAKAGAEGAAPRALYITRNEP